MTLPRGAWCLVLSPLGGAASTDAVWEDRFRKPPSLEEVCAQGPLGNPEDAWRRARWCGYFGLYLGPHLGLPQGKLTQAFAAGVASGKQAVSALPRAPEAHYWLAVNLAGALLGFNPVRALAAVPEIRRALDAAIALDPGVDDAGPLRLRGLLLFQLPGAPLSFGDKRLAREDFVRATQLAPGNRQNFVYLAQCLAKLGQSAQAKAALEAARKCPVREGAPLEEIFYERALEKANRELGAK